MVRKLTFDKIIPRAGEMDEKDEFPEDMVQCLAENSLLKLSLPEKYGGIDANTATLSVVITELSYGSAPIGTLMLATQSVIRVINQYGTEVQKDRMFSVLSSGDKLNAFCLTEPNAGSDARALQTKGY